MSSATEQRLRASVVVCTKDRPQQLARVLECLGTQTYPIHEIIVVDGSAKIERVHEAAGTVAVTHVPQAIRQGLTHARAQGSALVTGDFAIFFDDDTLPQTTLVASFAETFVAKPEAAGVGAVTKFDARPGRLRKLFVRIFQRGPFFNPAALCQDETATGQAGPGQLQPTTRLCGAAMAFRRDVLTQVEWDLNLRNYCLSEDMDYSYRASTLGPLYLMASVVVPHEVLGWDSFDTEARFTAKVCAFGYFYHANLAGHRGHAVRFGWLLFGIIGEAVIHGLMRRTTASTRGVVRGLRALRGNLADACDFIAADPRSSRRPASNRPIGRRNPS